MIASVEISNNELRRIILSYGVARWHQVTLIFSGYPCALPLLGFTSEVRMMTEGMASNNHALPYEFPNANSDKSPLEPVELFGGAQCSRSSTLSHHYATAGIIRSAMVSMRFLYAALSA